MSKYAKAKAIIPDNIEQRIVKGKKGFKVVGDERLSSELIATRVSESDYNKLLGHLENRKISKSQWAREVLTAAISNL